MITAGPSVREFCLAPAVFRTRRTVRRREVHDVVDALVERGGHLVTLRLGELAVLDRVVEPLGRGVLDRGLQPVDRLVVGLRDIRERLAVADLLVQLRRGDPEVLRRALGALEAEPEPEAGATEAGAAVTRTAGPPRGPPPRPGRSGAPAASRCFAASPCSLVSFPAATAASIRASAAPLSAASNWSRVTFSRLATSSRNAFCSAARSAPGDLLVAARTGRRHTPRRTRRGPQARRHRRRACALRRWT